MAIDTSRWRQLHDEIAVQRAVLSGLRARSYEPRQQQLRLTNDLARLEDRRQQRVGAALSPTATTADVVAAGPQPKGYHRPATPFDGDFAIIELRRQKAGVDSEVAALDAKLRETSARLRSLTELRAACEAWARQANVVLPGVDQERTTMVLPAVDPRARPLPAPDGQDLPVPAGGGGR